MERQMIVIIARKRSEIYDLPCLVQGNNRDDSLKLQRSYAKRV